MTHPYYGADEDFGDDDLLGEDDDFGAAPKRVNRLLGLQARLQAMLATNPNPARAKRIKHKLALIQRRLGKLGVNPDAAAAAVAASGIEGAGSLLFTANSPPGIGRLLRLPFNPVEANPSFITAAGEGLASTVNPTVIADPSLAAAGQCSSVSSLFQTPQISWATLRLVGFESSWQRQVGISNPGGFMFVKGLKIGGGANLFTHENFADATIYDAAQPEFCGLRDYPIIKSPNIAQVEAFYGGDISNETLTGSFSLLVEVLVDDNYGAHIPGAYARKASMIRQGGSFV